MKFLQTLLRQRQRDRGNKALDPIARQTARHCRPRPDRTSFDSACVFVFLGWEVESCTGTGTSTHPNSLESVPISTCPPFHLSSLGLPLFLPSPLKSG